MGVVYGAVAPASRARVAVKTVTVSQESLLASIRREIHALSKLDHPGVVRVLATGVDDGRPWYAMEHLQGTTLAGLRDTLWARPPARSPSSHHAATATSPTVPLHGARSAASAPAPGEAQRGRLARVLTVMRRVLATLAYIHGEGIVHRDLKPHNVFVRDGDQPVLVDFGIASRAAGITGREVLDAPLYTAGTPAYIAPEQVRGDPVDSRSDLYSLGCVLYELLTGRPPFLGDMALVLHQHLDVAPRPPSELIAGYPPELDRLVLALLQKRARDRIGHAEDVIAALDELGAQPEAPHRPVRAYVYRPELTGRTAALASLEAAALAAARGEGRCVLIAGESGVGKTYLAQEAARASQDFAVIVGTCAPVGAFRHGPAGQSLHPFTRLFQLVTDRCTTSGRAATDRLVGERGKILAEHDPGLAGLPGQDAYRDPPALYGAARRDRLLAALADTVSSLSEDQPVLLLLDDLQWADDVSMRFLTTLGDDWFYGKRVLMIGTYRVEETTAGIGELLSRPYTHQLEIGQLDDASIGSLVSDMLAIESPPDELVRFLALHSAGNPFFIAEYLRAATAEGLVRRGQRGRLELGRALPITMPELVSRRLDGMLPGAQRLAAYASVMGHDLDADVLRDASGASELEALDALAELVARQILEPTDGGGLRFVHDKLCEIAYGRQEVSRRNTMHHEVAEAIERRIGLGEPAPRVHAVLAHHYLAAGSEQRAVGYLERAGDHALAAGAYAQAADWHRKLLQLGVGVAGDPPAPQRRARWMSGLAKACFGLGDLRDAETHARATLATLGRPLPGSMTGWTQLLLVEGARRMWQMFGPTRAPAPPRGDDALVDAAQLAEMLTQRYYYVGDAVSLVGSALLSVNLAERAGAGAQVPVAYSAFGYVLGLLRQHALAMRHFQIAYDGAAARDDVVGKASVLNTRSLYHVGFGELAAAHASASEALKLAESDAQTREIALNLLGHIDYYAGRLEDSERRYALLLRSAKNRANHQRITWCLFTQARVLAARGRPAEGLALLREARQRLVERPELDSEIIALGLLAGAEAASGARAAARSAVGEVLERVRRSKPGGFSVIDGYDGAATALIMLTRRHGADTRIEAEVRELVAAMTYLARLFPMAEPYALLHRGELERLRGNRRRAVRCVTRARDLAGRMLMGVIGKRAAIALDDLGA